MLCSPPCATAVLLCLPGLPMQIVPLSTPPHGNRPLRLGGGADPRIGSPALETLQSIARGDRGDVRLAWERSATAPMMSAALSCRPIDQGVSGRPGQPPSG